MVTMGKTETVGFSGRRVDLAWTRRAHAAAYDIGADHKEAVGIDRFAGAHRIIPPAGLTGDRMRAGDELVAGKRMTNEDCVGAGRVQCAVRHVGDAERR
jgi:hypothetical protein